MKKIFKKALGVGYSHILAIRVKGMVFKPFVLVKGMVFKPIGLVKDMIFNPFGLVKFSSHLVWYRV